eukprot:363620-Chlamydomonas_euryale.AAC.6
MICLQQHGLGEIRRSVGLRHCRSVAGKRTQRIGSQNDLGQPKILSASAYRPPSMLKLHTDFATVSGLPESILKDDKAHATAAFHDPR